MQQNTILSDSSSTAITMLKEDIRKMYTEIVHYKGSFGDPIEHGLYDPYQVIRDPKLTAFERTGVSIAILHYLECAIDNSTYESALADQGPLVQSLLTEGFFDHQPVIRSAIEVFFKSESEFIEALKEVFEEIVQPEAVSVHDA